jgi:CRISPR-associated Csx10 family RAMP protein
LAEAHASIRHNTGEFNEFFFDKESSFGNLYPDSFGSKKLGESKSDELQSGTAPVLPLPATALSCKRFGGFTFDEDDPIIDPHHGVYDTLIPWALFALSGETRSDLLAGLNHCSHDSGCQEAMDRIDGFYRRNAWDAMKMGKANIRQGLRTRTGISRQTGAVAKGILYSREVLGPSMRFWGAAAIAESNFEAFRGFVQEANATGMLRFGSNRTRSMGHVVLEVEEAGQVDTEDMLAERVQHFNQELREQASGVNVATRHDFYVPLTLVSDVILVDHLLRYQTQIDASYLREVWQLPGAELVYHHNGIRRVMGWQSLLRIPKSDEVAIMMGSVFLFGFSAPLDEQKIATFLRLQNQGIGARRREGFGRVMVASPFHWEVKGQ